MEFGELRPVLSGLAGGLIAIWLGTALGRWIPEVCNQKRTEILVIEYRYAIWCANILLVLGLIATMALFSLQVIRSDDWRALGIGIGGGSFAALISLAIFGISKGSPLKEAYVAYAVSQKVPLFLIYGILTICVAGFFVAVSSFLA